jgi:gamma-glutamylcysteine synthetase
MNNKSHQIKAEEITLDDWTYHLSTIFTEVRLKTYIEMRVLMQEAIDLFVPFQLSGQEFYIAQIV